LRKKTRSATKGGPPASETLRREKKMKGEDSGTRGPRALKRVRGLVLSQESVPLSGGQHQKNTRKRRGQKGMRKPTIKGKRSFGKEETMSTKQVVKAGDSEGGWR